MTDAAWLDEGAPLPASPGPGINRLMYALRRRKWWFILVSMPIFLIGLAYLLITPKLYTAHGTLMVGFRQPEMLTAEQARDPVHGDPDIDGAIALMRTPRALRHVVTDLNLATRPVLRDASGQGEAQSPSYLKRWMTALFGQRAGSAQPKASGSDQVDLAAGQLRKAIKIERVGRSALLDIAYASHDPVLAAAVVNALAKFSSDDEGFLSGLTLAERAGFQIVKTTVVAEAVPPYEPSSPNGVLILGGSVFCALAVAFGVVLLKEFRLQQTVLNTEEITRRGLRPLGLILASPLVEHRRGAGIALVVDEPGHAFSTSVESLHAAVSTLPRGQAEGGTILLLTSALSAEGKSTAAAALATSMAVSGSRVLLIDADLRSPALHRCFDLDPGPGLVECVGAQATPEQTVRLDPVTGVYLLTAGQTYARPLRVLGSARFRSLLELWRTQFDTILIDSPPILLAGDARLLAQAADNVIVVARWGWTTWNTLMHALRVLAESGARVAGVTVSRVDDRQLASYGYADSQIYDPTRGGGIDARRH